MNEPWNEENIRKKRVIANQSSGHQRRKWKNEHEVDAAYPACPILEPKWCQVLKPMTCQACSPPRLLNMLRKPQEGLVVLLAGEGGKGPASTEGSHYLENLHACIFLPSVRNPCLAYQRDRFEHFQHTFILMFLLQRPELSAVWLSPSLHLHLQALTPRLHSITSVSCGQPLTEWSLHAPVATTQGSWMNCPCSSLKGLWET